MIVPHTRPHTHSATSHTAAPPSPQPSPPPAPASNFETKSPLGKINVAISFTDSDTIIARHICTCTRDLSDKHNS